MEEEEALDILAGMPELHVLSVGHNQIVRQTREYRRWMIYKAIILILMLL